MENTIPQHKDRLFRLVFGEKENILSLYNALNDSHYDNPEEITITTLGDAIYAGMKNDVSFLLASSLPLWEHQSTYNPNMPLRGLLYFSRQLSSYVTQHNLNLYGRKLAKIPAPKYAVFYNGKDQNTEDRFQLRLSDAFEIPSPGFEWTADVYNINKGRNRELMEKCKPLADYAELVARIRENQAAGMEVDRAVDEAVKSCIEGDVLKPFLLKHRSEVIDMCLTEFDQETYEWNMKQEYLEEGRAEGRVEGRAEGRAEGRVEGRAEGRVEGILQAIISLVKDGLLDFSTAASRLNMSVDEFQSAVASHS